MEVDDDADWYVPLLELLPEERHLRLLLRDATLHAERRIAGRKRVCFVDLSIGPGRVFHVKRVAKCAPRGMIIAVADKKPVQQLEDVVGECEVPRNAEAPPLVPRHDPACPCGSGHRSGGVYVPV